MKNLLTFSRVQTQVAKTSVIAFPSAVGLTVSAMSDNCSLLHDTKDQDASNEIKFIRINFKDVSRRL